MKQILTKFGNLSVDDGADSNMCLNNNMYW